MRVHLQNDQSTEVFSRQLLDIGNGQLSIGRISVDEWGAEVGVSHLNSYSMEEIQHQKLLLQDYILRDCGISQVQQVHFRAAAKFITEQIPLSSLYTQQFPFKYLTSRNFADKIPENDQTPRTECGRCLSTLEQIRPQWIAAGQTMRVTVNIINEERVLCVKHTKIVETRSAVGKRGSVGAHPRHSDRMKARRAKGAVGRSKHMGQTHAACCRRTMNTVRSPFHSNTRGARHLECGLEKQLTHCYTYKQRGQGT
ncbi:hypothetical protein EVAR_27959_1 [Eumeta japonica]|uniref:Uncharacterized protein n=1 Tax=Eumeta variegata TaxID=151549 RepID=A0A4C1ZWV7_EUMVA|nr:hypothetical protein EVAR_27959_1 [Eumeta japonica]